MYSLTTDEHVEVLRERAGAADLRGLAERRATRGRRNPATGKHEFGQADLLAMHFSSLLDRDDRLRLAVMREIFPAGPWGPIGSFGDLSMAQASVLIDALLAPDRTGFTEAGEGLVRDLARRVRARWRQAEIAAGQLVLPGTD